MREGKARFGREERFRVWKGHEVVRRRVSNPDWHHASWLNLKEVYAALGHFGVEVRKLGVEVRAMLGVMEKIGAEVGEGRVRVVFWFDG